MPLLQFPELLEVETWGIGDKQSETGNTHDRIIVQCLRVKWTSYNKGIIVISKDRAPFLFSASGVRLLH